MVAASPNTTVVDVECLVESSSYEAAVIAHGLDLKINESWSLEGVLSSSGYRPLHFSATSGNIQVAESLIGLGAPMDAGDIDHRTPLHSAAFEGHSQVVKLLVSSGADANVKDYWGRAPMHNTVQGRNASLDTQSYIDVVKYLLAGGADVNARANDGCTPLRLTVQHGSLAVPGLLILSGGDVNTVAGGNEMPLRIGGRLGKCEFYDLLVKQERMEWLKFQGINVSSPLCLVLQFWEMRM